MIDLTPLYRLLPALILSFSALPGCSFYYDAKAEDMVERQMEAMVFVEGGEFIMGNPGGLERSQRHHSGPSCGSG